MLLCRSAVLVPIERTEGVSGLSRGEIFCPAEETGG